MTTSCHDATFDARILSHWLDVLLVQHSVRANRSVPGQREACLDMVFTKTSEDILSFDRGKPLGNSDHLSLCLDYLCFSCPSQTENRKSNLWKGDFEGMRRHLHLQDWDLMLVGDIETKWLWFKVVLPDLVDNFCPLARSKCPLAKPCISRRFIATKNRRKSCIKIPANTFPWALGQLKTPWPG